MQVEKDYITKVQENVRMSGFLEKKGKMKLMSQWKKYWFVLEERLLLYYRSEIEYANLSPCRGSLNMGLVTTVRPGSSTGPCIIHVITRTQAVQLRAKNRASQEEWLQALLHSMSLPLMSKALKSPTLKPNCLGYTLSLDNISLGNGLKNRNAVEEWTLPRKWSYREKQIGGSYYGGSLDTAIWSRKILPIQTQSYTKEKLEKLLVFPKENVSANLTHYSHKNNYRNYSNQNQMKFHGKNMDVNQQINTGKPCKVHDVNRIQSRLPVVEIENGRKKIKKTLSENHLSISEPLGFGKLDKKEESPFERIKNALSRIPRDKILKSKIEEEKNGTFKRRRQSFLHRVFRRKDDCNKNDCFSESNDTLSDTIEHTQRVHEDSSKNSNQSISEKDIVKKENEITAEMKNPSENFNENEIIYSEIRKPMAGSKTLLPTSTMSELKTKLKSRESIEFEESKIRNEEVKVDLKEEFPERENDKAKAPSLPPRRISRPVSPWHDVPTNNAPIGDKKLFFVHQAIVKFKETVFYDVKNPLKQLEYDTSTEDSKMNITEHNEDSTNGSEKTSEGKQKNDDLATLLEQLKEITVAPLTNSETVKDKTTSNSVKGSYEPDYDIPRPHQSSRIFDSQEIKVIAVDLDGYDNGSKNQIFFQSIEPDSLDIVDKKVAF